MAWVQVLTPTPTVACTPGWCLKYVSDAFGVSNVPHTTFSSATDAWNASIQHKDQAFPAGMWVPVWFSLANVPEGHVALLAPDGSVWSSSDPNTNVPHHHTSLAALIAYYANANPLTYLGWSEDIGGTAVIKNEGELMTPDDITYAWLLGWNRRPTDDEVKYWSGRPVTEVLQAVYDTNNDFRSKAMNYDTEAQQVTTLQGQLTQAQSDLQSAKQTITAQTSQLAQAQTDLAAEKDKSAGLAKNLNDSQLELKDAQDQLSQAESLASDDDAKIKDLTAQLSAAQATIDQLKAQADKPPAHLTSTNTSTPNIDSTQNKNLLSNLLGALVSFVRGGK